MRAGGDGDGAVVFPGGSGLDSPAEGEAQLPHSPHEWEGIGSAHSLSPIILLRLMGKDMLKEDSIC